MKLFTVAFLLVAAVASSPAAADTGNKHSCCGLGVAGGACVAQPGPCAGSATYGVDLADMTEVWGQGGSCNAYLTTPSQGVNCDGWPAEPYLPTATFPAGINGYLSWANSGPWTGFCLVAPNPQDPMHASSTEPIGCLQTSMDPGIGSASAKWFVPIDGAGYDAYQFCYGISTSGTCAMVSNLDDTSIHPTPSTGSCCGPALMFEAPTNAGTSPNEWYVDIAQEIPGVPPNAEYYAPDGAPVAYFTSDANSSGLPGDYIGPPVDTCQSAYDQPSNCGTPPLSKGGLPLDVVSDATTTSLAVGSAPSTASYPTQGGGCNVNGTPSRSLGEDTATLLALLGLVLAGRRTVGRRGSPS